MGNTTNTVSKGLPLGVPTQIDQSEAITVADARDQKNILLGQLQHLYRQIDEAIRDFEEQTSLEVMEIRVSLENHDLYSWPSTIVEDVVVVL